MSFLEKFDYSKRLSLYIHIPFCAKKCDYCAFYSIPKTDMAIKDFYTSQIVREIKQVNRCMNGKPYYTAFIGGGNPGCLGTDNLKKIAKAVCHNGRPVEFTTEMNPESLDSKMTVLFEKYFTRLSMGVQSLDRNALSFLGRNADYEETVRGLDLSQQISLKTGCEINYDMITCLGDFHNSLEDIKQLTSKFPSNHLSVYSLTLEEGTPLYNKKPSLPDEDKQADILQEIWDYLKTIGFEHYEVSNFARNNKKSLHNEVYWDYQQYMGLGCSAASTAFKNGKATRITIDNSVIDLIKKSSFELANYEELSATEMREEFICMGLRHTSGLDLLRLENEFKVRRGDIPNGFSIEDGRLKPNDFGLLTADAAALYIDSNWSSMLD